MTKNLINAVSAILLISPDAKRLAQFYQNTLGMPLEEEAHEGVPLHYACEIGELHFAIHPSDGWPGVPTTNAQSPVIAFSTSDASAIAERLSAASIEHSGPFDHGFAQIVSFRDPDGNLVEVLEAAND